MDYVDSESEVRFAPLRQMLMMFSVQNGKIAKISKTLTISELWKTCVNFRTTVYLCLIENRNELCVGETGHLVRHE